MKSVEIKCDACGADLTDAGAMPTYRLELSPEAIPNSGGIVYAVAVRPEIDRQHHFCGLRCLDLWRDRARYQSSLWRDWMDQWKDEHGTKGDDGRVYSYPSPPDEVRAARDAEFDAAVLAKFPSPQITG